jgi:hypothetical protein
MKWIKYNERKPEKSGRYLIIFKCESGFHNCLAVNYAHPCCDINIAYFSLPDYWEFATFRPIAIEYTIIHWMPLPEVPNE